MKTCKKLLSILLALVLMLVALPIVASAEEASLSQNFEEATVIGDAAETKGGAPSLDTVIGGDGNNTKAAKYTANGDALRFNIGTAQQWNTGSSAAYVSKTFKVSFDLKMEWSSAATAIVWFSIRTGKDNSGRIRQSGAVADATDYKVTDLQQGWKHFEFTFTKEAEETATYFHLSSLAATTFYLDNIVLGEKKVVTSTTTISQNFGNATNAADVCVINNNNGALSIETVTGSNGAETKVMRFPSGNDQAKFVVGTASHWDKGSATALTSDFFNVSFDIKMEWSTASTAVAWFNFKSATNGAGRIGANAAVADATDYEVTDLEGGWKRFSFKFTKTGDEAANAFYINNLTIGAAAIPFDFDNLVIDNKAVPVTTGDAAALRAAEGDKAKGIRVKNTVSIDAITEEDIVEYGSLVTMANIANDLDLEVNSAFTVLKGVAYDKAANKDVYFEQDDKTKTFTAVLVNINAASFDADILVRAYAKTSSGKYIYGDVTTFCVYDVVDAILAGNNAADKAVANTYVNDAITADAANGTVVTYAEWKAAQ